MLRGALMSRATPRRKIADGFAAVRAVGLTLPGVEAATRYDGSPVLKAGGCFVAGLATHRSAEPGTLVVRMDADEREWLIADAPGIYYLTGYYRSYPLVLARLSQLDRDALRDLLSVSLRLTLAKTSKRGRRHSDDLDEELSHG
jgi:hypothetical protein